MASAAVVVIAIASRIRSIGFRLSMRESLTLDDREAFHGQAQALESLSPLHELLRIRDRGSSLSSRAMFTPSNCYSNHNSMQFFVAYVFRTDLCFYSGFRIYPGHGRRYIRTDGRQYVFINAKSEASFHMKRKAAKHSWTQLYRRLNKKGIQEETQRRRNRRKASSAPKAVEGASLEVIKAKRNQRPEVRKAAREAALKDIKERKKATKPKARSQVPSGRPNKMPVAQRR